MGYPLNGPRNGSTLESSSRAVVGTAVPYQSVFVSSIVPLILYFELVGSRTTLSYCVLSSRAAYRFFRMQSKWRTLPTETSADLSELHTTPFSGSCSDIDNMKVSLIYNTLSGVWPGKTLCKEVNLVSFREPIWVSRVLLYVNFVTCTDWFICPSNCNARSH